MKTQRREGAEIAEECGACFQLAQICICHFIRPWNRYYTDDSPKTKRHPKPTCLCGSVVTRFSKPRIREQNKPAEKVGKLPIITYRMRMEHPTTEQPKRKQMLRSRLFWFLAGSGVNYLLIATPFKYLKTHTELPILAISACSLGISTSFFFVWNYFINFRTDSRKRDALARYLGAVLLMYSLSTTTLTILKHFDAKMAFSLGRFPLDLDIIATQFFLAGLKFFLYHKWVFPVRQNEPVEKEKTAPAVAVH